MKLLRGVSWAVVLVLSQTTTPADALPHSEPGACRSHMIIDRRYLIAWHRGVLSCSPSWSSQTGLAERGIYGCRNHGRDLVLRERGGRADEEDEEIEDSFEGDQGMEALGGSRGLGTGDDWLDEYLPEESRKEWAWAFLKVGGVYIALALTPVPIFGCFMNRKGLIVGNAWITLGCILLFGPTKVSSFLTDGRRQLGSAVIGAGWVLIWRRWCLLGVAIEALGLLGLIGDKVLKSTLSILFPLLPRPMRGAVSRLCSILGLGTPSVAAAALAAATEIEIE